MTEQITYAGEDHLGRIHYPFPLANGQVVQVALPNPLSAEDAERLAEFVLTLVVDEVAG